MRSTNDELPVLETSICCVTTKFFSFIGSAKKAKPAIHYLLAFVQ